MNASSADMEQAATASDDALPPRVSLELFVRRRSDLVFFGLTELSGCLPVSVAARNLKPVQHNFVIVVDAVYNSTSNTQSVALY